MLIVIIPIVVIISANVGVTGIALILSTVLMVLIYPLWKYMIYPASCVSLREFWQSLQAPFLSAGVIFLVLSLYNAIPIPFQVIKLLGGGILWAIMAIYLTKWLNKPIYSDILELSAVQLKSIRSYFSSGNKAS
jgi:hypothetical protein